MKRLIFLFSALLFIVIANGQQRELLSFKTLIDDTVSIIAADNIYKVGITVDASSSDSCTITGYTPFTIGGEAQTMDSVLVAPGFNLPLGSGSYPLDGVTIATRSGCKVWLIVTQYYTRTR